MSLAALQWAYALRLPAIQKAVLAALAYRHNAKTGQCDPAVETLAGMTGLSCRSVQNALGALADAGALRIVRRREGQRQASNAYVLNLDNRYSQSARGAPSGGKRQGERDAPSEGGSQGARARGLRTDPQGAPPAPNREDISTGVLARKVIPFQGAKSGVRS